MPSIHCPHHSIRRHHSLSLAFVSLAAIALASCSSKPARIQPPDIDASSAGSQAIEQYDADGDGYVGGKELERAPGLRAALGNLDKDGDGRVSADEVAERVQAWQQQGAGLTNVRCVVLMNGRPLEGAEVVLEPEAFLGDEIETAVATSGSSGNVSPVIPKDQRPTPGMPPGLRLGLYTVKISKMVGGKETVPARYNSDSTLGLEVAMDAAGMNQDQVKFDLSSK